MQINYFNILSKALEWAEERDFTGYSKFDALNSTLLKKIASNYFLRAGFVYTLSRSPINIRSFLLVTKKQNPKGLSLFSRAYFNLYKTTNISKYLNKANYLINTLLELSQYRKFSGHCWGYEHAWQSKSFFTPEYFPNTVVTVNVGEAILDAYDLIQDAKYSKIAESITNFIENDLTTIIDSEEFLCSSYIPGSNWKVINVNALLGGYFSRLYKFTNNDRYLRLAKKYISWVVSKQTEYGAWFYADPPNSSSITHDNYHTGFVLDAIFHYMEFTNDMQWEDVYEKGLYFYKKNLFSAECAPKWTYAKIYPHDIHGVAQGIITFTNASKYNKDYLVFATKIANWGIKYMYNGDGRFIYQKGKYWTKRFTLMRWCQAWMCYALSVLNQKLTKHL